MPIKGLGVIILYNILLFIMVVLGVPLIMPIILSSEKRRKTFPYRLGIKPLPDAICRRKTRNSGNRPVWVHALSVGEVLSAVPLVTELKKRLKRQDIFFSVSTQTGFVVANTVLKKVVDAIFFYPYDLAFCVKSVVKKINPALVLIVETDIWPNFIAEVSKRKVPIILGNARLSTHSFLGYKHFAFFSKLIFLNFSKICAQSRGDALRFRRLGIPPERIIVSGNVKFDQVDDHQSAKQIESARQHLGIAPGQKVLVAGSTHDGEESVLLDVLINMRKNLLDPALIVAPRDPKRARAVSRIFNQAGIAAGLMTEIKADKRGGPDRVIVVDTIGVLRKLYALADIAFIGGSFANCGGHNPLEPAAFSKPILFGPDMSDFAEISRLLLAAGGGEQVHDAHSLFNAAKKLIKDNQKSRDMGKRAFDVFCTHKGALESHLNVIISELLAPKKRNQNDVTPA